MSSGASVALDSVRRVFSDRASAGPVVSNFTLEIKPGEFVALLGPSGCGKSTLLRMMAGLDQPDQGEVKTSSSKRGFVFQEAQLLPWRNVLENTALPLELMKQPREQMRENAFAALRRVGLEDQIGKYPSQLSGGMKMRVSVARALVSEPDLLLLDEPFAALDEHTRFHLQEDLRELWEKLGMTTVFVTHSVSEAVFLADRAVVLSPRPARILLDTQVSLTGPRSVATRVDPLFTSEIRRLTEAYQVGGHR